MASAIIGVRILSYGFRTSLGLSSSPRADRVTPTCEQYP
ncbi:hypothetical protein MUK42_31460 [Musa troglodytarum]|uniref:Uncharacterized protein n=1 Tax=Musa troglodytarum TaxID=320322 RepID=A0A9E7LAX9_9LILI|nr:hypothetical protein MUK42_31460 [Musa troglodytarum]